MLPQHLIDEIKDEFKDNSMVTRLINSFFEENSTYLKPVIDKFVEEKLDEVDQH